MDQEKIGKLIKRIRKENNLTQKQLADKYGVTYQAVSKWENGKNIPDISLLRQISRDFGIDIKDILEGNVSKKNNKVIIASLLFIFFLLFIFILLLNNNSFSFSTLSSQCSNYNITGSVAYNSRKSSIYISDINYCGKESNEKYKKIECTLYESGEKLISRDVYNKEDPIDLSTYLKGLNFKIDDYKQTCKKYDKDSFYIKIKTVDLSGKVKSNIIKLSIDNC